MPFPPFSGLCRRSPVFCLFAQSFLPGVCKAHGTRFSFCIRTCRVTPLCFLVPEKLPPRTYCHGRARPARAIGAVPLFWEYVFLSSYKTVFAVPSKPVMPARQKGSPVSVHVFLCRKDCLPHILSWSRLPGKGCVHYTIFLIAAAPSKAETLGRRFSPRAAAKNPLHRSL